MDAIRLTDSLREAARQLRREPVRPLFIALTMAIGIAAAGAIFTVARAVVMRPLPYRDATALVAIQEYQPAQRQNQTGVAYGNLQRYEATTSFAGVTAFSYSELVLSGGAEAERIIGAGVDANLFSTLGVLPLLGRGIESGDMGDNPARVVVIAYGLWQRRFGADRALLDRSVVIDGEPYTVIGITPERFEFPRSALMDRDVEAWVPRRTPPPMMIRRGMRDLTVVARLGLGVTQPQAHQELTAISKRAEADDAPLNAGWRARAVALRDVVIGRVRPTIVMLAACVGVLLLIACVNASAALLARVTMRRQAFGVRLALGANSSQLVQLVMAEVALLAIVAGAIAVPLGTVVRRVLVQVAPVALPRQQWIAVDGVTLVFTGAVTLVAGVIATVGPVLWLRRIDVKEFLSDASRTTAGSRGRTRSLAAFVVAQLALGTSLLAVTLTAYGGFVRINRVNPGFVSANVTTATIPLRGMRYRDGAARSALTTRLLDKVRTIPGVEYAAVGSLMPMSGGLMSGPYQIVGSVVDSTSTAVLRAVSTDFFQTLGIAIMQGRAIGPGDDATAVPIVVVNQSFVRQAFAGRSALGAEVLLTPPGANVPRAFRVVGVAADAKEKDLVGSDSPIVYFSDAQASFPHTVLAVRSNGPAPLVAIRAALGELDPALALDDVGSLASKVRGTYGLQFFLLNVLGAFAVSALVLIGVGVYGTVSYVVSADVRAIGVRMALGATRARILSSLILRTIGWSLPGCIAGLALSLGAMRLIGPAGLSADVAGALAGAVVVFVLALGATWHPAWQASRADPLAVLRTQ